MRRKDRAVTDQEEILKIISKSDICRLAMVDEGKPYMIPLNFGYAMHEDELTLVFHSARVGRKIDAMHLNPDVCFEMDCEHALIEAEEGCDFSFAFSSIIGFGKVEFIFRYEEKLNALRLLMKHQTGRDDFHFSPKQVDNVTLYKIVTKNYSAKRKPGQPEL
ncbi:MAG: pyridoxamine 5'-phosphate oxidase family protein [Erysipelotrichales bacterium]|nr:MAG: pyridoxamine 5'-phosphate oxidase family protein [Erysipelotrichales bacterium]